MSDKKDKEMADPQVLKASEVQVEVKDQKENGESEKKKVTIPVRRAPTRKRTSQMNMSGQVESAITVGDDAEKPSYEKLVEFLDQNHPRTPKQNKEYTCDAMCAVNTGCHYCLTTTKQSDMDRFGIGMVLYFRFLKYLIWFFVVFCLLTIPSLYFAIQSAKNFSQDEDVNYQTYLYYTTIGSIGRGATQCREVTAGEEIEFFCSTGELGPFDSLQYGIVVESQDITCELFSFYSWAQTCNYEDPELLQEEYEENCEGKGSCVLTMNPAWFDLSEDGCSASSDFYFRAACYNIDIELPNGSPISKRDAARIIAGCDAAISVLFMIMILTLTKSDERAYDYVISNVNSVEYFTVQVKNIPKADSKNELRYDIWKIFNDIGQSRSIEVVDVQFAEPNKILNVRRRKGQAFLKRQELMREFYKKYADDKENIDKITMNEAKQLANKKGRRARFRFLRIEKLKAKELKYEKFLSDMEKKDNVKFEPAAAFVTFENKKSRDIVYNNTQRSPCSYCCYRCCPCCFEHDSMLYKNKYLRVKDAPAPNNIRWENMDSPMWDRLIRRFISWVITFALWIITIAFITFIKDEQQKLAENVKPTKDCSGYDDLTEAEARVDSQLGADSEGLVECFCRADSSRQFNVDFCTDWAFDYYLNYSLPFVIVFAVIFTNFMMQFIFKALASFERHRSISSELSSRVIKIFVAQFLNTGIIILVLNAKIEKEPVADFLDGTYDDFIPEWYLNIGVTLLVTMIINAFSLPVVNIMFGILRQLKRCCDRRCTQDKTITKKKKQKFYNLLYLGPEFLIDYRYAQILTVMSVCFLFGAGLPLLYFSTLLQLIIYYWFDKYFVFKVCRKPKNYDAKLEEQARQVLYGILVVHVIFAIWVYGNEAIFGDNQTFTEAANQIDQFQNENVPYLARTWATRATQEQNIGLLVLFALFLLIIAGKISIGNILGRIYNFCCGKKMQNLSRTKTAYKTGANYYDLLSIDDMEAEDYFLQEEINKDTTGNMRKILEKRRQRINSILAGKKQEDTSKTFQGLFSYYIGHNPDFEEYMTYNKKEEK